MPGVFVSYRRADSLDVAGRLCDHLRDRLGAENVFKDVDDIRPGTDFRVSLSKALDGCDVALVLVGQSWLTLADDAGRRRLDDPEDFVRLEVQAVLRRGIPVIPVLIGGAPIPSAAALPGPLRPLAYRQAAPLRPDPDFRPDVERLTAYVTGGSAPGLFGYRPGFYLINLALIVSWLALLAFWPLRYTDWLDRTAFLAATGGFALLVVALSRVVGESARRRWRTWLESRLLLRPRSRLVVAGMIAATLTLFSGFGALRVTTVDDTAHTLVVFEEGEAPGKAAPLVKELHVVPCRTLPWRPRRLHVRISGLPTRRVELGSFEVERLVVPDSFLRPVVLVRCESLRLAKTATSPPAGRSLSMIVKVDGAEVARVPFTGESVSLGCDEDLGFPPDVRRAWEADLVALGLGATDEERLRRYWFAVSAAIDLPLRPKALMQVEIALEAPDTRPLPLARSAEVSLDDPAAEFPQTLTVESLE